MTITTRQTSGVGVTAKNAPLTNAELDQNFIDLANGYLASSIHMQPNTITNDITVPDGYSAVIFDGVNFGADVTVSGTGSAVLRGI